MTEFKRKEVLITRGALSPERVEGSQGPRKHVLSSAPRLAVV